MSAQPEGKYEMFRNRLGKLYRHRSKLAGRQGLECYRLYDRDLPEFPWIIEIYADKVYASEYRSRHRLDDLEYRQWYEGSIRVMEEVLQVSKENIFCKLREPKDHRQDQYVRTAQSKQEFVILEGGLRFIVNLSDYLDTGLFLDHRLTRAMVRDEAKGKKILNLFCYTGSFTVYAAAGEAAESLSVDLSNTYIDWAARNLELNGADQKIHRLVKADVLQYLPAIPNEYYDIVILDPPSFSNSKMMKDILDIQRDHVELINQCLLKTVKGGIIYFSTNLRGFRLDAGSIKAASIHDITKQTTPFDFQGKLLRWCYRIIK